MIRGLSTVVPPGRELATDQRSPRFETRTITGASHSTLLPLASENNQFTGSRDAPVAHADPEVEFQLLHGMLVERRHITFMDSPADYEQRQRALRAWKDGDTSAATMTVLNDLRIEYGRVTGTFQWDPEEVFIEDPK